MPDDSFGRGVCGLAAAEKRTVKVEDVREFPGHIACDDGSRSELVVPIVVDDYVRHSYHLQDPNGPVVEACD